MKESESGWTEIEQKVARFAFEQAYKREIEALISQVRHKIDTLDELDDIWQLHDFLSARRYEVEGKYDFKYSILLFIFAGLIKDGWLQLNELEGLDEAKLAKVAALSRM
jgi:hypothetical protein